MATIRKAVGQLQGLEKVSGDVKARTVLFEYNPATVTVTEIQQALDTYGYDSTVIG